MSYARRYQKDAKAELQQAQQEYGSSFTEQTERWLDRLTAEAENKDSPFSIDLVGLLEADRADRLKKHESFMATFC